MKIVDKKLLDGFREAWRCEWCDKPTPSGCDPHHIYSRGAGRLDVRINLIALCREDHQAVHAGKISREDLLAIVARREGCLPEDITTAIWLMRADP